MPLTPRLSLPTPLGTDSADVPTDMSELATALDATVIYGQGTVGARPTSTPGSPGIQGRIYYATDEAIHYYDTGTGWIAIGTVQPNSVGTLELKDNSVTLPKMADAAVGTAELINLSVTENKLADNSVTYPKVHQSLKPSQGAGASQEALRSLGTVIGQAAPGQHRAQHDPFGADPIDYTKVHLAGLRSVRPAAVAGNAGLFYFETDTGALWRSDGSVWVRVNATSNFIQMAQWPGAPVDGDMILVAWDVTQSLVAHFRYNAASSSPYKWEHIGAGPQVYIGHNQAWGVPRTGTYAVDIGSGSENGITNSGSGAQVTLRNLSTGAEVARSTQGMFGTQTTGITHTHFSVGVKRVVVDIAAGHVLQTQLLQGGDVSAIWSTVRPVRVA